MQGTLSYITGYHVVSSSLNNVNNSPRLTTGELTGDGVIVNVFVFTPGIFRVASVCLATVPLDSSALAFQRTSGFGLSGLCGLTVINFEFIETMRLYEGEIFELARFSGPSVRMGRPPVVHGCYGLVIFSGGRELSILALLD